MKEVRAGGAAWHAARPRAPGPVLYVAGVLDLGDHRAMRRAAGIHYVRPGGRNEVLQEGAVDGGGQATDWPVVVVGGDAVDAPIQYVLQRMPDLDAGGVAYAATLTGPGAR